MPEYYGVKYDDGSVWVWKYGCWKTYLCRCVDFHGNKAVFSTTLFSAENYTQACITVNLRIKHYENLNVADMEVTAI